MMNNVFNNQALDLVKALLGQNPGPSLLNATTVADALNANDSLQPLVDGTTGDAERQGNGYSDQSIHQTPAYRYDDGQPENDRGDSVLRSKGLEPPGASRASLTISALVH